MCKLMVDVMCLYLSMKESNSQVCKNLFPSIPLASIMSLHFRMQEEDMLLEYINVKCQVCALLVNL